MTSYVRQIASGGQTVTPKFFQKISKFFGSRKYNRLMQKHVGSSKRFYGDELRRSVSRRRNAVFACARTRVSTVGFVTKRVSSHFDGVERLRREQVINSPSATVKLNNPQACINYYPRKSYHSHICKQLIHSEII